MSVTTDLCQRIHGIVVPLPIFYRDDLSIDYEAMQRLAAWYLDAGIETFIFTYTFSQISHLTAEENVQATRAIASVTGERAVLIATTQGKVRGAVDTVERLAEAGADGVFIVPDLAIVISYGGDHYIDFVRDVAKQTDVPILLNAYRSVLHPLEAMIPVSAYERLMEFDNFAGLKEDINLTPNYRAEMIRKYGNRLAIIGGGIMRNYIQFHHVPNQGELAGVFNPQLALRITNLLDQGRLAEALGIIERLEQVSSELPGCDVYWLSAHQVMFYALGFAPTWKMRPVLGTATQQEAERLAAAMRNYPEIFPQTIATQPRED